jgi:NTE family protein
VVEATDGPTAFVLGGGGILGAAEVGMLNALHEHGVRPDLILGTSVGALNGAVYAADPDGSLPRLTALWEAADETDPFAVPMLRRAATAARSRTHVQDASRLRAVLQAHLAVERFEDLRIPFQCVAASIERAGPHWFSTGPLLPALLASSAVPGILPPVEIDGEHYVDGGLVDAIPIDRALGLGARTIWVLEVGRLGRPLSVPTGPSEVVMVALEIVRRSRFSEAMERIPPGVRVHLLPSGADEIGADAFDQVAQVRGRDGAHVTARIDAAYRATRAYLGAT